MILCVTRVQVVVCVVSSHIICRSTMSQFHISAPESPGIIALDWACVPRRLLPSSPPRRCFSGALRSLIINPATSICQLRNKKEVAVYVLIWALFHRSDNMTVSSFVKAAGRRFRRRGFQAGVSKSESTINMSPAEGSLTVEALS